MTMMNIIVRWIVTGCAIALVFLLGGGSTPRMASPIEEEFKYGSIGAEAQEGIPYWIWQVLPRMFADKLPPGGYGALGMIWEPGHDTPIGFSKKTIWGVSRVAINCAFCHTAVGAHQSGRRTDDRARRRLAPVRSAGVLEISGLRRPAIRGSTRAR